MYEVIVIVHLRKFCAHVAVNNVISFDRPFFILVVNVNGIILSYFFYNLNLTNIMPETPLHTQIHCISEWFNGNSSSPNDIAVLLQTKLHIVIHVRHKSGTFLNGNIVSTLQIVSNSPFIQYKTTLWDASIIDKWGTRQLYMYGTQYGSCF